MIIFSLLSLSSWAVPITPTAGIEWTPFSKADAVWIDDGRTSGTTVGEFDGVVRPQLSAFGGIWIDHRWGLTAGLGLARLQQTVWADDVFLQRHWAVIRPSLDLRICLIRRDKDLPIPWILLGGHADFPSAGELSNGFTDEETEQAEENAAIERARIGGVGARLGAGVDYGIHPYIRIGLQLSGEWHRAVYKSSETQQVSSWIGTQAALFLAFEWPKKDS